MIFGTSYVAGQKARYAFQLWAHVTKYLNPGIPIVVIDAASPMLPRIDSFEYIVHPENLGHPARGGRDGPGKAWIEGIRWGLERGFDHIVHIETDVLLARPAGESIAKMRRAGVRFAAPLACPYDFPETALMFMEARYLWETDFCSRYDWEGRDLGVLAERHVGRLVDADLFYLPLRGARLDGVPSTTPLRDVFPDGVDWITHAGPGQLREFMAINGISEP